MSERVYANHLPYGKITDKTAGEPSDGKQTNCQTESRQTGRQTIGEYALNIQESMQRPGAAERNTYAIQQSDYTRVLPGSQHL